MAEMNESRTIRLSSGCSMPLCGLGTWNLRGNECMDVTAAALSAGCCLVDTAHIIQMRKKPAKAFGKAA